MSTESLTTAQKLVACAVMQTIAHAMQIWEEMIGATAPDPQLQRIMAECRTALDARSNSILTEIAPDVPVYYN